MKKLTARSMLLWPLLILLTGSPAMAQDDEGTVTGTVISQNGDILSGVSVVATNTKDKDENYSSTTNEKGVFVMKRLKIGSVYNFVVSYVGYETSRVNNYSVKGASNSILIKLTQTDRSLDQVVVIGYGTQKRETVTGSIATVRAEDFNAGQITDPMTLIAGKVAGLSVSRPNGSDPNAAADFSLRGRQLSGETHSHSS